MTESMATVRLSDVMTGCGGKLTTCSRRSINGRMRSTNGTRIVSPGVAVRTYRPNRSTTAGRACGTIRTERTRTNSTTTRTTSAAITPPVTSFLRSLLGLEVWPFVQHHGGRPADLHHPDDRAGREDLPLIEGAGRPLAAVEPNPPVVGGHLAEHDRLLAHQAVRPGRRAGAGGEVLAGDGPHAAEKREGRDRGHDALQQDSAADGRGQRGGERAPGEHDQDEGERGGLGRGEHPGDDEPDQPFRHGTSMAPPGPITPSRSRSVPRRPAEGGPPRRRSCPRSPARAATSRARR